jgi:hypothetical protein
LRYIFENNSNLMPLFFKRFLMKSHFENIIFKKLNW